MPLDQWAALVLGEPGPAVGAGSYPARTKRPRRVARQGADQPPPSARQPDPGDQPSPRAEQAIALLSLSDAFYLLNRVVEREYRAWETARSTRGDQVAEQQASRLSSLLAKHLDTFGKLVRLARDGQFDIRELEMQEQPRLPLFETIQDEATRRQLLARYEALLAQEEELLRLVEQAAESHGAVPTD
jgi:hypothetical protein